MLKSLKSFFQTKGEKEQLRRLGDCPLETYRKEFVQYFVQRGVPIEVVEISFDLFSKFAGCGSPYPLIPGDRLVEDLEVIGTDVEDTLFDVLDRLGFVNPYRTRDELLFAHDGPPIETIDDFVILVKELAIDKRGGLGDG